MFAHPPVFRLFVSGSLVLFTVTASANEPSNAPAESIREQPNAPSPQSQQAIGGLVPGGGLMGSGFGVTDLVTAANDLRIAGESFEQFGGTVTDLIAQVAESISRVSSEFDPFGYKTAFRTITAQTDIIQQQQQLIFELQNREIKRLQVENRRLQRKLSSDTRK